VNASSALRRLVGAAALVGMVVVGVVQASATEQAHSGVVSERPAGWTPHILDGTVHAITTVGGTLVVGGSFTEATDATEEFRFHRPYLLAFGAGDGRMSRLTVRLDGPVYGLAPGPDNTVYVGGGFRTVNGTPQRGVTQLRLDTGERVPGFRAEVAAGWVKGIVRHGNELYIGGNFMTVNGARRAGLARLDATTGALDGGFDPRLESNSGRVHVRDLALTRDGSRLVAVGGFARAQGVRRAQLVMFDTARGTLSDWFTDAYEARCAPVFDSYTRGVDFAPDGSYLVVVTTGGRSSPDLLCDTAARFDVSGSGRHGPRWVNHTGGHTLYSVAVTGAAVYVGGHQLWQDNPHGWKRPGPGAVPREGIAALHPVTGKALSWNPGRARGVGVQAFYATPDGLFVGSDTTRLGGVYRARIGMFPLDD
jgi:beta-propeller uncharacterized protein DUF5122